MGGGICQGAAADRRGRKARIGRSGCPGMRPSQERARLSRLLSRGAALRRFQL